MFELYFDQHLRTIQQRQASMRAESEQTRLAKAAAGAHLAYDRARLRAHLSRLWAWLRRKPNQLQPMPTAAGPRYGLGTASIPIQWIAGSENRSRDFDRGFNPTQTRTETRWEQIFALMETGDTLPPVDLLRIGDHYYVRDGHHRISVAKALGRESVDAVVTMVGNNASSRA